MSSKSMRAVKPAHAVIHIPPKQSLGQVPVLNHGKLEGVTLELGVVVGVDGATHALNDHCTVTQRQVRGLYQVQS